MNRNTICSSCKETYDQGYSRKWRKILYEKQQYDDDYVDETFLEQLVTNENISVYEYWNLAKNSTALTQQISIVVIFFSIFMYSRDKLLTLNMLTTIDIVLAALGFLVAVFFHPKASGIENIKSCFFLAATLSIVSPVLRTLTKTYAGDTIWALAITLSAVHLVLHDYSFSPIFTSRFVGTISLNASIFCSVLLASRLESNEHVFAFMLFAIELFAIFPIVNYYIRCSSMTFYLILTFLLVIVGASLLAPLSSTFSYILILVSLFITFICPLWLIYLQQFKNEIQGPWDIAKVKAIS